MQYVIISLIVLLSFIGKSQAQPSENSQYTDNQQSEQYSEAQLAQILAPIALYPDTLLTHILIASTYPIELVQAQRWLDKYDELSAERLADMLQSEVNEKNWDASVKALMSFPNVIQRLSDDLDWTQNLGDAFLSSETQVLASIQQLRKQAQQAGSLSQMANSSVSYEDNNIVIEPQQPQVIYVPYYDVRQVYGTWHWGHYPPIYWAMPKPFYSAHYSSYHQPFYWHSAVHIRTRFFFSAFHWHNRHVVVINHYNKPYYGHHGYNTNPYNNRKKIVTSTGAKRWQHKPQHRRGVAYSNKQVNKRFNKRVNSNTNRITNKSNKTKKNYAQTSNNSVKREKGNHISKVKSVKHYQTTNLGKNSKQNHNKYFTKAGSRVQKSYSPNNQRVNQSKTSQSRSYPVSQNTSKKYKDVASQSKPVRINRETKQKKSEHRRSVNKTHRIASTSKQKGNRKSVNKERR